MNWLLITSSILWWSTPNCPLVWSKELTYRLVGDVRWQVHNSPNRLNWCWITSTASSSFVQLPSEDQRTILVTSLSTNSFSYRSSRRIFLCAARRRGSPALETHRRHLSKCQWVWSRYPFSRPLLYRWSHFSRSRASRERFSPCGLEGDLRIAAWKAYWSALPWSRENEEWKPLVTERVPQQVWKKKETREEKLVRYWRCWVLEFHQRGRWCRIETSERIVSDALILLPIEVTYFGANEEFVRV